MGGIVSSEDVHVANNDNICPIKVIKLKNGEIIHSVIKPLPAGVISGVTTIDTNHDYRKNSNLSTGADNFMYIPTAKPFSVKTVKVNKNPEEVGIMTNVDVEKNEKDMTEIESKSVRLPPHQEYYHFIQPASTNVDRGSYVYYVSAKDEL